MAGRTVLPGFLIPFVDVGSMMCVVCSVLAFILRKAPHMCGICDHCTAAFRLAADLYS